MSAVIESPDKLQRAPGVQLPETFHIDWDRLNPFKGSGRGKRPGTSGGPRRVHWGWAVAGVVTLLVALFLIFFHWNMLRGPIGRFASARTGRVVRLEGDLKVHLFSLAPRVDVGGLKIGNPAWGPKRNMAEVANVSVTVRLLPLLTGRVQLPRVAIEHPTLDLMRDAQGRANWDFSNGKAPGKPFKLPPIQTFIIDDGRLTVADAGRKLSFTGVVNATEERGAAYDNGFRLTGQGALNRRPFLLNVRGGPLINVQADRPYPFDADIRAGATHVAARGQVPKPFDLGLVNAAVSVSGKDLNDLYDLTGLALPNTPPYQVSGQLRRDGLKYYYDRFSGRIGGSDIGGDASVDTTGGRPFVRAKLHSRLLDFADLGGLFGAPGASKAAAPDQKAEVRALAAKGRLLPDATLQVDRIRGMDAKVDYTAAQVRAPGLPLRTVRIGADLDHGVLKLDPIALTFPSGSLTGTARIDARKATPVSDVDLRVGDVRLEDFVQPVAGSKPISGTLTGRARLTGAGDSVHKAAAASNGAVTAVIPRGQMRQAFAELLGIDVTKGLFLLLAKDQQPTDVRCALADFEVRNGVLNARRIVFDTGVVLVNGSGTVNLDDESLDLTFKGKPKKLRAVRLAAPITVGGQLRQPKFGVEAGPAVAQAGVGVALGALLSPLAAILPFVSPGLEKDANCAGLLADARQSEARVSVAARATTPAKGASR